jgi:cytochrome b561
MTVGLLTFGVAVIYGREAADERWLREGLLSAHRWAGMLVWAGCWVRLALRLFRGARWQRPVSGRLMNWAATVTHVVLYALLLTLPLLGWALSSARGQFTDMLGLSWPLLIDPDPDLVDEIESAHRTAALTLLGLALFHALAAVWHHFVLRDGVLASMSFEHTRTSQINAPQPGRPSSPPVEPT